MRGIGLSDWFDSWTGRDSPRRRRKALESKAGEKFDDYLAHPARRAPAPPPRAGAFDPLKHRSFDRQKTPRAHIPWKRTASAPRALSEAPEAPQTPAAGAPVRVKGRVSWSPSANASRSRSSLSLARGAPTALARTPTQRFYAPNERPVSRNRPHPPPPPAAAELPAEPPAPSTPATSLTEVLAEAVLSSSNLASLRSAAPAPAATARHHSLGAVHTRRSSLASTSLTSAVLTEIAPALALPESSRHRRAHRAPGMQYSASVPSREMPAQSMPYSASAPVVHAAAAEAASDTGGLSVKKKKRPPPLVTPSIPHGFPGAGLREARMPEQSASARTLIGNGDGPSSPDKAAMQQSVSPPAVHVAGQEHLAAHDTLPRPAKAEIKKKARPPPLITPDIPHGFPAGGLREARIQGRSISAKTAMESNPYPHGEPPMQHSASSSSSPAVHLAGEEHLAARDSLPRPAQTEIKKKARPPPLITPAFPHGFPAGGLREARIQGRSGSAKTARESNPYPHGEPHMQHSASSPPVHFSSQEHVASQDTYPRPPTRETKKKARPPPLVTPSIPHGFPGGGLRESHMPSRSSSAKKLAKNGRYSYDDPSLQMQGAFGSMKALVGNGRYSYGDQPMQLPGLSSSARSLIETGRFSYDDPSMPMYGRSESAKTLVGNDRYSRDGPVMQHSVSSPPVHFAGQEHLAAYDSLPRSTTSEVPKNARPPPSVAPSVPHGMSGGGHRASHMLGRSGSAKTLIGNPLLGFHDPTMQHSASSPSVPSLAREPRPVPSAAEIKKKLRSPPRAGPSAPSVYRGSGFRASGRDPPKMITGNGRSRYNPNAQPVPPGPEPFPRPRAADIRKKMRPPPLVTAGYAHGFASGGMRDATPVPDSQAGASVVPVSPATTYFAESAEPSASEPSTSGSPEQQQQAHVDRKEITPPRVSFFARRSSSSSTLRFSDRSPSLTSRPLENPESRYDIEEAPSLSSLGDGADSDTPSAIAAKNGIFPVNQTDRTMRRSLDDVSEDMFLIGADGVFKGGGFVITENGMLQAPGNLTRSHSFGTEVDGAPKSFNNNLIHVRSLAEFARGSTLSRRNKLDSTLGAGAAGRVSLAVHRPSGRKIAVKRINVFDVEKRTQLLKELETLMRYESRFLVRSYGAFYDGEGVVHVTLEYMDRGSLEDVIHLYGRLPEDIVKHIIEHCLLGLMFLHDNHVLHRDFKTGNILLSARVCRAKLSDFGLARDLNPGESRTDSYVGTVAYMSPERLTCGDYTYASDIWGLGICVLECLLGKHPFDKPQSYFDYVDAAKSDPSTLLKGASAGAVDFVRQCTAINPAERPTARNLLSHPWMKKEAGRARAFREWMRAIPGKHGGEGFGEEYNRLQKLRDRANGKR